MAQPPAPNSRAVCGGCGRPLYAGQQFCPACGGRVPVVTHCPACGAQLVPGARFCPACGRAIAAAAAAAPAFGPRNRPAAPAPYPAGGWAAQPRAAARSQRSVSPPIVVAAAGFAVALAGLLLPWASINAGGSGITVGAFKTGASFRLSDWLSTEKHVDGLAVLLAGIAGLLVVALGSANSISTKQALSIAATIGGAMTALALMNMQFLWGFDGVSPSYGLYALAAGGILPTIARWITPVRRK
jgi:Double zinc ribbon